VHVNDSKNMLLAGNRGWKTGKRQQKTQLF
jgi:hypothetical protein